jgi:amidohydrolase
MQLNIEVNKIKALVEANHKNIVSIRRSIHRNPELAYEEFNTSALVITELKKLGFEVVAPLAKTGVVGLLRCKNPESKCIALRADMDALPITEKNNCDYKSGNEGKMHACGHDAHTATLLGVAYILAQLKDELEGTVKFIFQPSEEKIPSGAKAMIKAGVLENPKVEKIFGWHVHPEMEAGQVGFCPGKFMASSDEIYLTVKGKGGHAAQPQNFISPLIIAAEILLALQELTNTSIPRILTFGKISANGATNIVPDIAEIAGTLRCFDETLRKESKEQINQISEHIAQKHGGMCEVNILEGYPVLINDETVTHSSKQLTIDLLGTGNVFDLPVRMGSEDFAYYTHKVPACFYRVGVGNQSKGIINPIHSPNFDIDEEALKTSVSLMSWITVNALSEE